jgi:CHASE3 domain sensor protein
MVAHTLEVLTALEHIKSNMAQAESAQRGYFLQPQPSFLREREQALDDVRDGILAIQRLTSDNPDQSARIVTLRELFLAQSALFLVKPPNGTSGQDAYFADGALVWNQLGEQTDKIRATETTLLASRIDEESNSGVLARRSFALFMLLLFISLCLLMTQAYRDIGRKRRAGEALHVAEDELAVGQRAPSGRSSAPQQGTIHCQHEP